MPNALQRMAPFIVLAGVALLPRPRDRRRGAPRLRTAPASRRTTDPARTHDASRGRQADAPRKIPRQGWKDILIRTRKEYGADQIPLIAAGVTFYSLLALFPALGAFVALYGLFADVATAQRHLQLLSGFLPPDALQFLGEQMMRLAAANPGGLSLALVGGLVLSMWGASGAMRAMITALNIAYDETEERSFLMRAAISIAFTLGFIVFGALAITLVAAPPAIEAFAGRAAALIFAWISWPAVLVAMTTGLALLYRFGPSRERAKWRWISWGSVAAILLWVAASAAFSLYVANFANYERTYGSLGAAIGFIIWVYYSTQVILLGAELNAEIEHQTARDTTTGPERPMGQRGAVKADSVAAA